MLSWNLTTTRAPLHGCVVADQDVQHKLHDHPGIKNPNAQTPLVTMTTIRGQRSSKIERCGKNSFIRAPRCYKLGPLNRVTRQAGQWRPGLLQAEDLLLALISSNSWALFLSQSNSSLTAFLALFSSISLGNLLLLLYTSWKAGWLTSRRGDALPHCCQ